MAHNADNGLPHPDSPDAPKYWAYETSGILAPAMTRYLKGEEVSIRDLLAIRAYCRQWVNSPAWDLGPPDQAARVELSRLRETVGGIVDLPGLESWLQRAINLGMDPL